MPLAMNTPVEPAIRIEVSQINRAPIEASGLADGALLDLEHDRFAHADGPISWAFRLELVGPDILVSGSVSAPLSLLCSRCARFFSTSVRISSFFRTYGWDEHPEVLDLSEDVREDVLLEIPGYPVCRPDCKGLCPQCGGNRNEVDCGCVPPELSGDASPWSALDQLKWGDAPQGAAPGK